MEDILRIYKKELLERIGLKKTINKTNEQIILDNFKYFDLNGNNYCNLNEFIRANERLGIEMRKKDDLVKIFHYFDKNYSNVINYRIFAKQILGLNNNQENYIQKNNYINNTNNNNLKEIEIPKNHKRNGYLKRNMASYDNIIFNSEYDKYDNKKKFKEMNNYIKEDADNEYENNNNNVHKNNYREKIPITEKPFFEKIISFLLRNDKYLPSKALLLFYKNFKIMQRRKSYNNITLEELINILSKNKIDLYINNIHELFNYYKSERDGNFYYEKFFEDLINIYWNEERTFISEKKIKEILYKYRNKEKVIELNKIRIEDFYNLISITQNNNYNIISVNNYFRNKLNILNPDEYYNEIVRIFMEIKYLTTANKDSTITNQDIFQLIKFISFGIESNEDFFTAINYIFNTNKYAILNKETEKEEKKKKLYEKNVVKDKYNYNTSLSSLISIRKYMIDKGIATFIKLIKNLNYYSNGRFIKKYDFSKVLKDFDIHMTVNDIEQIFDNFSGDKNKLHLNYFKFIDILLSEFISKERIELINYIYEKIENELNEVNFESLNILYNPKENYYKYDENNFFENLKNFHFEFYLRKLPEEQRQCLYGKNNFRVCNDEFLDFYKMISFIIEKDEIFNKIIKTEWNQVLEQDNKKGKENYSENKEDKNYDFDDYDEYNVKPKEIINYKKLKNDLSIKHNYNNNYQNDNDENICSHQHKNDIIKIPIPINSMARQNSNKNINHNQNINIEQKRIFRPNSSKGQFNNINNNRSFTIKNTDLELNDNLENNISPLEKLTKKLKMRGLRGLMNLHKQFIFTCPNLSKITLQYFIQVLKNQKINLEKFEYNKLFNDFTNNNNNEFLDFTSFIREFKKPLNDKRLSAVEDAFSLLDVDSNDNIFIETIKKKYNPKGNPLVKCGKKNEEEVATEFLDCFELNYNLLTAVDNQNVTNVVSFEEFANFYEYVSFLFDDDDDFVQMVNESWND